VMYPRSHPSPVSLTFLSEPMPMPTTGPVPTEALDGRVKCGAELRRTCCEDTLQMGVISTTLPGAAPAAAPAAAATAKQTRQRGGGGERRPRVLTPARSSCGFRRKRPNERREATAVPPVPSHAPVPTHGRRNFHERQLCQQY